jgi:hypothetical protein
MQHRTNVFTSQLISVSYNSGFNKFLATFKYSFLILKAYLQCFTQVSHSVRLEKRKKKKSNKYHVLLIVFLTEIN